MKAAGQPKLTAGAKKPRGAARNTPRNENIAVAYR